LPDGDPFDYCYLISSLFFSLGGRRRPARAEGDFNSEVGTPAICELALTRRLISTEARHEQRLQGSGRWKRIET